MPKAEDKRHIFSLIHSGGQEAETTTSPETTYKPGYISSIHGLLKCTEVVLDFLIFIIISLSHHASLGRLSFLSLTGGVGFCITGVLLGCYCFNFVEKYNTIPWQTIELGSAAIWTLLLAIGSTVCLLYIGYGMVFGIVPFFGYINSITYGYDGFLKFTIIRKSKKNESTPNV